MYKLVSALVLVASVGAANAGYSTWDFTPSHVNLQGGHKTQFVDSYNKTQTAYFGNYVEIEQHNVNLKVNAWSDTKTCAGDTYSTDYDSCVEAAELKKWSSGLGSVNVDEFYKENEGSPQHAVDNYQNASNSGDFDYDALLLDFNDEKLKLTNIDVGWDSGNKPEVSILAYTGNTPFQGLQNKTWESLVNGGGWELIDHYYDVTKTTDIITNTSVTARYWLVGAYNELFGDGTQTQYHNDAFKLAGLTTYKQDDQPGEPVNTPASAVLLLAGMAYIMSRRRKQ